MWALTELRGGATQRGEVCVREMGVMFGGMEAGLVRA